MPAPVNDSGDSPSASYDVHVPVDGARLPGILTLPDHAKEVVLFAHGSGSSRHSPRNRTVAAWLNSLGIATLLFDLLSEREALDRDEVFDVKTLAGRLRGATGWVRAQPETTALPIGYFGGSTGAAAALSAAAEEPTIAAVVSRGGRPDLVMAQLDQVRAPTLLIVGGNDETVLDLNRQAFGRLRCPKQLEIVAGATHLFDEPGALDAVSRLTGEWFSRFLGPR